MRIGLNSKKRASAMLLAGLLASSVGCKTASWMPSGGNLFSWNRDPDPALLAAESPDVEMPQGPASKYEPNSIASFGGGSATRPAAYGNQGLPAQTVGTPQAGLAAQANGYQTGPYQTGTYSGALGGALAAGGSNPAGATAPAGFASPYGGSPYAGASSAGGISTPTAPNVATSAPGGFPAGLPQPGAMPGYGMGVPSQMVATPAAGAGVPAYTASTTGMPGLPRPGATLGASLPTAGSPTTGMPAMPPLPSASTPPGLPAAGLPSAGSVPPPAYQGATQLGGFSPGTTGRRTPYDFGSGQSPAAVGGGFTLPPNTASGTNPLLR